MALCDAFSSRRRLDIILLIYLLAWCLLVYRETCVITCPAVFIDQRAMAAVGAWGNTNQRRYDHECGPSHMRRSEFQGLFYTRPEVDSARCTGRPEMDVVVCVASPAGR